VEFSVGESCFEVHKTILEQSDYFKALISERWNSGKIVLEPRTNIAAFRSVLRCLYTHDFEAEFKSDLNKAVEMLKICNEILFNDGIKECTDAIMSCIRKDPSLETINQLCNVATEFSLKELEDNCNDWLWTLDTIKKSPILVSRALASDKTAQLAFELAAEMDPKFLPSQELELSSSLHKEYASVVWSINQTPGRDWLFSLLFRMDREDLAVKLLTRNTWKDNFYSPYVPLILKQIVDKDLITRGVVSIRSLEELFHRYLNEHVRIDLPTIDLLLDKIFKMIPSEKEAIRLSCSLTCTVPCMAQQQRKFQNLLENLRPANNTKTRCNSLNMSLLREVKELNQQADSAE